MTRGTIRLQGGGCLFANAERTVTRIERLRGLLGRQNLAVDEVLWLDHCNSVHSFGMKFPIDLAYLGRHGEIRKVVPLLRPQSVSACWGACVTLEMAAGSIDRLSLETGMGLEWKAHCGMSKS